MDVQTTIAVVGGATGIVTAAVTLSVMVGRPLRKLARQNDEFRQDWYGTPARPGRDAVLGVPERLKRIESEFRPDGGGALWTAVNRNAVEIARVETRLSDHIAVHPHVG